MSAALFEAALFHEGGEFAVLAVSLDRGQHQARSQHVALRAVHVLGGEVGPLFEGASQVDAEVGRKGDNVVGNLECDNVVGFDGGREGLLLRLGHHATFKPSWIAMRWPTP
ncbi:hypothetical protein D3C86_797670 [compost metagenome]